MAAKEKNGKNYQELTRQIDSGSLHPVYLFTGPEKNIRKMMEDRMSQKLITPGLEALNFTRYQDPNTDIYEIIAALQTLPVMSEKRIVILEESTGFLTSSDARVREALEDYLKAPSPSTVLIFEAERPDKRGKLYKAVSQAGETIDFAKLDEGQVRNWIVRRLKNRKVAIDGAGLEAVLERTHYLENESVTSVKLDTSLEKLADLAGEGNTVTAEMVYEAIPAGLEDNVFKMTDLLTRGEVARAIEMLRGFLTEGEAPLRLFGLIVRQVRIMAILQTLSKKNASQQEMAKAAGIPPFVVRKTLPAVRRYEDGRLLELLSEAADTDLSMKSGGMDPALELELYVLRMASRRCRRGKSA